MGRMPMKHEVLPISGLLVPHIGWCEIRENQGVTIICFFMTQIRLQVVLIAALEKFLTHFWQLLINGSADPFATVKCWTTRQCECYHDAEFQICNSLRSAQTGVVTSQPAGKTPRKSKRSQGYASRAVLGRSAETVHIRSQESLEPVTICPGTLGQLCWVLVSSSEPVLSARFWFPAALG
eukprot:3282897-Amphidinium_carterae.1